MGVYCAFEDANSSLEERSVKLKLLAQTIGPYGLYWTKLPLGIIDQSVSLRIREVSTAYWRSHRVHRARTVARSLAEPII